MTFPTSLDAASVGQMVATGFVGNPPLGYQWSVNRLKFAANAANGTAIANLSNPVAGEAYSISPADGRIKMTGSALQVGATATTATGVRQYILTRTLGDSKFSDVISVEVV